MAFGSPYYGGQQYPVYQPYGQQYQPMQQTIQPQQMPQSGLNRVTGYEGARAFQVPANSIVPLFDDTQDVFYIKTTDSGGFPTIKAYRFSPMEDAPTQQAQGLTRPEIEQIIREEIAKYEQQFVQPKPQQRNTGSKYDSAGTKSGGFNEQVSTLPAGDAGQRSGGNAQRADIERPIQP